MTILVNKKYVDDEFLTKTDSSICNKHIQHNDFNNFTLTKYKQYSNKQHIQHNDEQCHKQKICR